MRVFIESQFSYCPLLWMFCSRRINRRINYTHERALRLVYDDYISSFEDLLRKDSTVSIHHRNVQKVAIEMYKIKYNVGPQLIDDLFCKKVLNTRSKASFHRANVRTVAYGEQSLRSFSPIVWDNMVPQSMKEIANIDDFKKCIKTWIPINCPCRLCKNYVPNVGFVTICDQLCRPRTSWGIWWGCHS